MTEVTQSTSETEAKLIEMHVKNLGVIEDASLIFSSGLTALTGETGAGKTLIVTALQLLTGQRADSGLIGPFGEEARVDARYTIGNDEMIISRAVPKDGRSRAYINGSISTVSALSEITENLIEIHGQHGHTSLEKSVEQRKALDRFAKIDLTDLTELRKHKGDIENALLEILGKGDSRQELEFLRFQEHEISQLQIEGADEEEKLKESENLLADATGNQFLSMKISETLNAESSLIEELGKLLQDIKGKQSLQGFEEKVTDLIDGMTNIASEARNFAELIDVDPHRLEEVQERIALLQNIRRKYGETLQDVLDRHKQITKEILNLENAYQMSKGMQEKLKEIEKNLAKEEKAISVLRKRAAPEIAKEIESYLHELSLPEGKVEFQVSGDAGEKVEINVSLNRGQALQPLNKVASGGELARTTLAARLVLSTDPETLIFDEVDAGIGGQTAMEVGKCLKKLSQNRQVIVVTHLAQVASYADSHIKVTKKETKGLPSIAIESLDSEERIVEISRMLSGSPDSENARKHALELLENAVHVQDLM
jgi:DNA repair protein RecN (Recombination protein N)